MNQDADSRPVLSNSQASYPRLDQPERDFLVGMTERSLGLRPSPSFGGKCSVSQRADQSYEKMFGTDHLASAAPSRTPPDVSCRLAQVWISDGKTAGLF